MGTIATRRERVVLDLESNLPEGMMRGAGATQLLRMELDRLSKASVASSRAAVAVERDLNKVERSAKSADRSINQLTGRLRLFADAAAILGPAAVPAGGVLAAGVAGFASQLGFAAVAGGVLVGSMQGLGDALSALNDAHLEPTAENLSKAEDALNKLAPAAANFAREAYGMLPVLRSIRDAGAEGLFPGLTDSLDDLERLAPAVSNIFTQVGTALGGVASGGAASLASDRWSDFFEFIATEAPQALSELATTVGSLTHGLAELWMAFAPLNADTSGWMMDVAAGFDAWAAGLAQTDGFRDFVEYIRATGPQVADTLGALGNMFVQIVQAAAPLGGPTLAAIEGVAKGFALIADSPIGSTLIVAASAMAIFNRSAMLVDATQKRVAASSLTMNQALGRGAAVLGGLAIASSGVTDGLGITNTATLALMGTVAGPFGVAFGAGIGLLMDWNAEAQRAEASTRAFGDSLAAMSSAEIASTLAELQLLLLAMGNDADNPLVPQIRERIALLQEESGVRAELAAESSRLAAQDAYYNSLEAESAALEKNIGLMQAKRDEALRSFSAQTNYSQSLLDSKQALEENGRAWNLNTEAGLKNRRVVEQQASSWNELNRTQGQTPAQAQKARQALIETATSLGATKEEARRYARQLMDIPNDLHTKIGLDVDTAMQRAKAIKAELASIDRNIDVYVNVRRPNAGGMGPQVGSYASGGFTGKGGKYEPAGIVHRGEVVIPQELVKADWGFLRSRYGHLPGFADGGFVGRPTASSLTPEFGGMFDLMTPGLGQFNDAARNMQRASQSQLDAAKELTDAARSQRDAVQAQMDSIAQGTVSGFNSGLFDKSSNPWAAGAGGGPLFNLNKDIAGLGERDALQQQLAALGLTGDAANALLSQGSNADIAGLIERGEVGQFASLYQQRASLQGSVGAAAGQMAYGASMAAASDTLVRMEVQVQNLTEQLAAQQRERDARQAHREAQRDARADARADRTAEGVGFAVNTPATKAARNNRKPKVGRP